MSDFTPITTQEDFDKAISARLARETAKYADYDQLKAAAEKYKDYDTVKSDLAAAQKSLTELQGQYADLDAKSKEKDTKIAAFEASELRTNVAVSKKLPLEMRKYLQGSTEDELKASADELIKFGGAQGGGDPSAHPEKDPPNSDEALYLEMAKALKE